MAKRTILKTWLVISIFLVVLGGPATAAGKTIYVDDDGSADFNNIQAGIDASADGDTVLVAPGTYTGEGNRDIDFEGKAITVKSEEGPQTCIIDCQGTKDDPHRGFFFHTSEDANSVLQGFTITNGYIRYSGGGGIYCDASSPRIENCTVTRNVAWSAGGIACKDSNSVIANCIISDNIASSKPSSWYGSHEGAGGGITLSGRNGERPMLINCIVSGNRASKYGGGIICGRVNSTIVNCTIYGNRTGGLGTGGGITSGAGHGYKVLVHNCIIWGNTARTGEQISHNFGGILGEMILNLSYCSVQDGPNAVAILPPLIEGHWTSEEPYFTNPGQWDPNGTQDNRYDDFWVDGDYDYHLKSQASRWDPNSQNWIQDDVTSPCIDAGDPNSPIGHEPFPNGGIINIGAYGGTAEASKSYFGQPVCETIIAGDINGDCIVDWRDFALMAFHWLEER
jgi:hypothetical protein